MGSVEDADRDLKELLDELSAEISFVAKKLPGELGIAGQYADPSTLSQVERRLLVRSVFSFIEVLVFNLKIASLVWDTNKLSPAEIALIKEEEYDLDESGVIRTRKARLRFFANFRFAFAVAAKAAEVNYHLDVSGDGWLALRTALTVRDRIMHPKRATDLRVSDEEVRNALKAFRWVFDQWGLFALETLRQRL